MTELVYRSERACLLNSLVFLGMATRYGDTMDRFTIRYRHNGKNYNLRVERIMYSRYVERFRISGGVKHIVVESNRPLLIHKGLKHKAVDWKLIEGDVMYPRNLEEVLKLIEVEIKKIMDR